MNSIYRSEEGRKAILDSYEEILKHWPVPYETLTVPTSFGDTFVVACGEKTDRPIVLLHGSSTNSAMWMGDAVTLSPTRRVYAVDIIGEPGKSSENRPDPRGTDYGQWLGQVFDGLHIDKAALVGNSLGGWMALQFASYAPKRVESLILLASGGLSSLRIITTLKMLRYASMGAKGEAKLNKLVYGKIDLPEDVLAFERLVTKHYLPRTSGYGALPGEVFGRLNMPVLFIGGDSDMLLPSMKNAAKLKVLVPQAEVRIMQGCPHALIGFAPEIIEFLAGNEGIK